MRRPGIEPGSQEWESCMIPLHQRRFPGDEWVCNGSVFVLYGKIHQKDENHCLQRGLNSRPLVYKTSALPLSYRGCLDDGTAARLAAKKENFTTVTVLYEKSDESKKVTADPDVI